MVLRNSLLGADVAKHITLLLIFSAHPFFLSGCVVETREILGAGSAFLEALISFPLYGVKFCDDPFHSQMARRPGLGSASWNACSLSSTVLRVEHLELA